jgi:hypothetical protein
MEWRHRHAVGAILILWGALLPASPGRGADGDTLWDPDGVEVGASGPHAIASDENGGAFVAYRSGSGVYVQRLDAAGVPQWTAPGVQVTPNGDLPAIAADWPWGATVAWQAAGGGCTGLCVQRVDYSGVVQWTSGGVQVATSGDVPVVIHAPGSPPGAFIAWGELARIAHVDGSGAVTAPGVDGIWLGGGVRRPGYMRMISDGAGGAIVVWADYAQDIVAQRVNAGLPWGTTPTIVSNDARSEGPLDAAPDGAGGALISWAAIQLFPANTQMRVQRIDSDGISQWTAGGVVLVDSGAVGGDPNAWISFDVSSSLATDGEGGAIVAWTDWRNETDPMNPGNSDIFAQRVGAGGSLVWTSGGVLLPPYTVGATAPGSQFFPETVSDGNGGAVVTYQDLGGNSYDISATRLDAYGTRLFSDYVFTDFMGDDEDQKEPRIVFDGSGPALVGAVIAWDDDRSGLDIRAQKVEISGPDNDDAADAGEVTTGTFSGTLLASGADGSSTCGGADDVWYVFNPPGAGTVEVDTCGTHDLGGVDTGTDTVVSLHSAAPGTSGNQLACNDDWSFGGSPPDQCSGTDAGLARDSATSVEWPSSEPIWIRVANYSSSPPDDFVLHVRFVPEPARWMALASGVTGLAALERRRRAQRLRSGA